MKKIICILVATMMVASVSANVMTAGAKGWMKGFAIGTGRSIISVDRQIQQLNRQINVKTTQYTKSIATPITGLRPVGLTNPTLEIGTRSPKLTEQITKASPSHTKTPFTFSALKQMAAEYNN